MCKFRQKWRCQQKGNFFYFWTKMKQNDDVNFVLPCFCASNFTGFILSKRYGRYTDEDICLRWGNTPEGGICLMCASQRKFKYFYRFWDKTIIFLLVIVGLSKSQILAEILFEPNKYIYIAYPVHCLNSCFKSVILRNFSEARKQRMQTIF